jgi:aminoglycoside/choline kinase family phosphotransferase
MVGDDGKLWIIDHQDARIGSPAYDLASLLLDRVTKAPDKIWLENKRNLLLKERTKAGLESIDPDNFAFEFDLVAVQRCLKAIGTFSNQAGNIGKTHYTVYIDPMFEIVSGICHKLNRFPAVREMIIRHTA